jgi:hypothetical protein
VLHANWVNGRLQFWGESPARYRALAQEAPQAGKTPDLTTAGMNVRVDHPFASSPDDLRRFLETLMVAPSLGEDSIVLRLPAREGNPGPSDDLGGIVETIADPSELSLETFSIPTVSLAPEQALRALLRLGLVDNGWSAGVRWWTAVAELAIDLLAEERFLPTLYRLVGNRLEARWAPWLDDPETRKRLDWLLRSMPPVVRAAPAAPTPWVIVQQALASMADGAVRGWLIEQSFADAIADRDDERDFHLHWLRGLLGPSAAIAGEGQDAAPADLFAAVRDWMEALASPRVDRPDALALRLEEPPPKSPKDETSAAWTLSILLARGESLVRAADVWRGGAIATHAEGNGSAEKLEELQEFILREVARSAALYPPLREVLSEGVPRGLSISTDQAYEFLRDAAPVLEESGIRIVAPSWWGKPAGRLGVRLLLDPRDQSALADGGNAGGASAARLGLAALVGYKWNVAIGDRTLSRDEFRELASRRAPLVRLGDQWVEVREDDLAAARALVDRAPEGDMTILEAMQTAYGVRSAGIGLPVLGVESSGWLRDLLEGGGREGYRLIDQPRGLHGELRPYQRAGLSWLAFLDRFGLGACLADDMGLGKTVQLIALLLHERSEPSPPGRGQGEGALPQSTPSSSPSAPREGSLPPTLIVAPMSVLSNWMREIQRFAPSLRVHVHHGSDRLTGDAFAQKARDCDVVITTYGLANRDVETLRLVRWQRVVLDEAQFVKNAPTKQAQAIRSLRAERRVALTGTPVENRLSELWSIMDFCNPGYLGPGAEFRREFAIPIERRRDHSRGEALRGLIRPFVLRRLKTDPDVVPDLPDLVESSEHAPLTDEQARMYRDVVQDMLAEVDSAEGIRRRGLVLAGIVRLKQICNHPASIGENVEGVLLPSSPVTGQGEGDLPRRAPSSSPSAPSLPAAGASADSASSVSLAERSGKVKVLLELLEEVLASGDRALVFTQYRRMGDLLARIIAHELHQPVLFLHGGTARAKRQEMIDHFQSPTGRAPVFILSLRAGGLGLNLTAANHVFHFDRWWNPAVENQATDRAFRIGQTKTVHVHKLICTGTLEDRIDQMIEEKTELAETIVGAGDAWLTELSTAQLRDLLTLRESALEQEP